MDAMEGRPLGSTWLIVLLVVVLVVGLFLRFYNLADRGLWEWDSAFYANIAKAPTLAARWLTSNFDGLRQGSVGWEDLKLYLFNHGVSGSPGVKPGHTLLLAGSLALLGIEDYAVLGMAAVFGFLTVVLVYKVGAELFDPRVGLVTATVLAVSGAQVFFSRLGHPQTDATFFSLLGTYLYLSREGSARPDWRLLLSGACFGFALTVHQSVVVVVGVVGLAELVRLVKARREIGTRGVVRDALLFGVPLLVPFLASEGLIRFFLKTSGWQPGVVMDLTPGARDVSKLGVFTAGFSPAELVAYPRSLWELEGPVVCLFLLLGLGFGLRLALRRGKVRHWVIMGQFVLPLIFWTFSGALPRLKAVQVAMPAMALIAGLGVVETLGFVGARVRREWVVTLGMLAVVGAVLTWGVLNTWDIVNLTCGYEEAATETLAYMEQNGGLMTDRQGSMDSIWLFYVGRIYDQASAKVQGLIDLDEIWEQGDYVVLDFRRYAKPEKHAELVEATEGCQPVIVVSNPMGRLPVRFLPKQDRFGRAAVLRVNQQPDADLIQVFDLRTCGERSE